MRGGKSSSEPDVYNFSDRGGAGCVEREYHVIACQDIVPVTRKLGGYCSAALGEGESEESLLHVVGVGNGTHPQKRDPADRIRSIHGDGNRLPGFRQG